MMKTMMIKKSFPDQQQTSARGCGAIVCRSYQSLCVVIRIAHIIIVILIFIIIIIFLILVIIVPLCITIFISLIITVVIIRIENIIIVAKTLVCMYVNRRRKRSLCLLVSKNVCNCLMCSCVCVCRHVKASSDWDGQLYWFPYMYVSSLKVISIVVPHIFNTGCFF